MHFNFNHLIQNSHVNMSSFPSPACNSQPHSSWCPPPASLGLRKCASPSSQRIPVNKLPLSRPDYCSPTHLASDGRWSPVGSPRSWFAPLGAFNLLMSVVSIRELDQRGHNHSLPQAAWKWSHPAPWPAGACCPGPVFAAQDQHDIETWSPCRHDIGLHSGYFSVHPHSLETFKKVNISIKN